MGSGLDFFGFSQDVRTLNSKTAELISLKALLRTYEQELSSAWKGDDATAYLCAVETICTKIDNAISALDEVAVSADKAILYAQEVDAAQDAEEGLASASTYQ